MNQVGKHLYWNGKKVLVTGGCGFVGSQLVRHLVSLGAVVRVADNLSTGLLSRIKDIINYIEFFHIDLSSYSAAIFACHNIEIVFDLAATVTGSVVGSINEKQSYFGTLIPALMMLKAASCERVTKYIYFSSSCVYSVNCANPISEGNCIKGQLSKINFGYSSAKRAVEDWVTYYKTYKNLQTTIIRPFNICGPGALFDLKTSHVIPALIKKAYCSDTYLEIYGSGNQKRSFIDVRDIAKISIILAEIEPSVELVNISSKQSLTIREIAELILDTVGKNLKLKFNSNIPSDPLERCANIDRLTHLLKDYHFKNIKESINDVADEYQRKFSS